MLLLFPAMGVSQARNDNNIFPESIPTITGLASVCAATGGHIYFTESGKSNYQWVVSPDGTITGGLNTYAITVSWATSGPKTVSVTYDGATGSGSMNVSVLNNVAVGVAITPSANNVCEGSEVIFTATPINGGATPSFNWKVNDISVAVTTTPTFPYIPSNNDIITCVMTSSEPCPTGNPATSNAITMVVSPNLPVGVSISTLTNPSCLGQLATYTALPVNEGPNPVYKWFVNSVLKGSSNSVFSYIPSDGDIISCQLTSNASCITGNPATSNDIIMTVSQVQPVTVTIATPTNPSCMGAPVTFTATPVNGGTAPVYSWLVNNVVQTSAAPTFTFTPITGDVIWCILNSNAGCSTGSPATSNSVTMTVNPYSPVSVSITPSGNPVCDGTPVTFTASPTNGGNNPDYEWIVNGTTVGLSSSYTYIPTNTDVVKCILTSSLACSSGNPATSNQVSMIVSASLTPTVSISCSSNPACQGYQVTFTASPVNGGSSPVYEWRVNNLVSGGITPTFSYIPGNNDVVFCKMTSSSSCVSTPVATSNSVTMTVSPSQPVAVTVTALANPVCQATTAFFTAVPVNGGLNPSYQWQVNGTNQGTNSPNFSYLPGNGDAVICILTSNATCITGNPATSVPVNMTVSLSLPVSVTVIASSNPSCQGETVIYTATPANGGFTPHFQWFVNGFQFGADANTYSYSPGNGDLVKCTLNSSNSCASNNPATSVPVTMTVNPFLPVTISIAASANPSCQGSSVTYTATTLNAGVSPQYNWKVNGVSSGSNLPVFTYVPSNNDVIQCFLTSSVSCPSPNPAVSNSITQTVNIIVTPAITISASINPVCAGTPVTYSASAVNEGPSPTFLWKLNGTPVGSNTPTLIFTPSNNDVITCQLTSSLMCVSGNPVTSSSITMVVSSQMTPTISISASSNPFCEGSTVNFTAVSTFGGSAPVYQWMVNGNAVGTNSPNYSYSPLNADYVTCRITSSLSCTTGPVTSNPLFMVINTNTPAGVTVTASSNPVCQGNIDIFTAHPVNGGASPSYQWKVNGSVAGTNSPTLSYPPSNNDQVTCRLTSNAACVSGSPVTSAPLMVTVNSAMIASVNITTLTNPFCAGNAVTYNASPVNGGPAPSYQWKVDGTNAGSNSPAYTYNPVSGQVVKCEMLSNASCISGPNPVESNAINMVSSATINVSITITASGNSVCQGTTVTYTAVPVNGGNNPIYQWKVNGINKGTNSPTYAYIPVNGDKVTCMLTSDLTCPAPTTNPATSNEITMIVNAPSPVSVSAIAAPNPVCLGNPVTLTATTVNGGTAPVYLWRVNGSPVGTNLSTYSYTPNNGDVVTCQITSNAYCISGNPALSSPVVMSVGTEQPVSITIAPSANPFCLGFPVTFTAAVVNGGTAPLYQWYVNNVAVGTNANSYTYIPNDLDVVKCMVTSNQACICNNPATSPVITMNAGSGLPVSVSVTQSTLPPICEGTLIIFNATPVNGGIAPTYHWKKNGTNVGTNSSIYQSSTLVTGDVILCELTSSLGCVIGNPATSPPLTMTVIPSAPVSIVINASANPSCQGSNVDFTAIPTNGGSNPTYQWKLNGGLVGTNSPAYSCTPSNTDYITCRLTSNATCRTGNPASSNQINMTVNPYLPVSVSIVASANPICQGSTVVFTASPTNGGSSPTYQWKVNGTVTGGNSSTLSYNPVNGDLVSCQMTSNSACVSVPTANSNTITMNVSPYLPVSVSIISSVNPVCEGLPMTFTPTPVNGGTTPAYQWFLNGTNTGMTGSTYTLSPVNGDQVKCILTSNAMCMTGNPATSNTIAANVVQNLPVSISISPSANFICQDQQITYVATGVNGGVSPLYQWMVNGMNVGTNSTSYSYSPTNGDHVTCQLTSSNICSTGNPAASNDVTMVMYPYQSVSLSITCSANPSCQGTTVTYTANPVNEGPSPHYQWRVNGLVAGADLPTYSYIPVNNDVVNCQLTSSVPCPLNNPVNSNSVTMSVLLPQVAGITISTSTNPACQGTPVTFNAVPSNGGSSPVFQWKVNGVAMGSNQPAFTYTPGNNDVVTCQLTSSVTCISNNPVLSNSIIMVVKSDFPASITITTPSTSVCQGQVVTFTASQVNGGTSPAYQWLVNGISVGTGLPAYTFTPSNGNTVQCLLNSSYTCASNNPASSNLIAMTVNPIVPAGVSIVSSSNPACLGLPVTYTATAVNGGASPGYQWKVNGTNVGLSQSTFTYTPANGNQITCQMTSSQGCITNNPVTSNAINMIIGSSFPVTVSIDVSANPICESTPVVFTATPTYGGSSPIYQWKVNGVNTGGGGPTLPALPADLDVYTCTLTSNLTCGSGNPATSNPIVMTVLPVPVSITIAADQTGPVCQGTLVTFTATPVNGGPFPTYRWKVNGSLSGSDWSTFSYFPANGDVISCEITSNATCASGNTANSNSITETVYPLMPVSISIVADPPGTVCYNTPVTFTATTVNPGSSPLYDWRVNGIPVGNSTSTFSYYALNGDMVTCSLTSNATCASGNPATSNAVIMTVLPVPVGITIDASPATPVCQGTQVTFTANPTNGGPSPTFTWKVNGIITGPDNPVFKYIPVNGDIVTCTMCSNATCAVGNTATSNLITLIVNPNLPVGLTISANPGNTICMGTTVNFTTASVNPGTNPLFQWKVNNIDVGANTGSFSYQPLNNDIITCSLLSDVICPTSNPAISNSIAITANPNLPVTVSISADHPPTICEGTSVTYTAVAMNGGIHPVYQWKVNGVNSGSNSSVFILTPSDGDVISCDFLSDEICATGNPATSNTILMTVFPNLPVSISISANPAGPVYAGTLVTYSANPVNEGSTPVYQWKVNNINAGTDNAIFNYIPVDGDVITCVLLSNINCPIGNPALSNSIAMIVNPYRTVVVSIDAVPAGAVCAGSVVTYTATPVNGGTMPSYQWQVNGINAGLNNPVFTYTPANGDIIKCILNSNETFIIGNPATSNNIVMVVQPIVTPGISITGLPAGPVCSGTPVTFTASVVNGGTAPSYQWKVNNVNTGPDNSVLLYTPVNGDIISCSMTSNAGCLSGNPTPSNTLNIQVLPSIPVGIVISATPTGGLCAGTQVTYNAIPVNPGTTPVYQWKVNGIPSGGNSTTFLYTPSDADQIQCFLTSDVSCPQNNPAGSNTMSMSVLPYPAASLNMCILVTTRDAKPIKLRGGLPLGGIYSGPGVINGYFTPSLIPAAQNSADITFTSTNSYGCTSTVTKTIQVGPAMSFTCGNTLTDIRDNNTYTTVLIGTQCWFRQNLNVGQSLSSAINQKDNCTPEKFCYNDNPANCGLYGGLYQWDELMQYSDELAGEGLCPPGWHVPTENDWNIFFTQYNGKSKAGEFLKNSAPGFLNAPLSGVHYTGNAANYLGFAGFFWSSTFPDPWKCLSYGYNSYTKSISEYRASRMDAFPVRCLKD